MWTQTSHASNRCCRWFSSIEAWRALTFHRITSLKRWMIVLLIDQSSLKCLEVKTAWTSVRRKRNRSQHRWSYRNFSRPSLNWLSSRTGLGLATLPIMKESRWAWQTWRAMTTMSWNSSGGTSKIRPTLYRSIKRAKCLWLEKSPHRVRYASWQRDMSVSKELLSLRMVQNCQVSLHAIFST